MSSGTDNTDGKVVQLKAAESAPLVETQPSKPQIILSAEETEAVEKVRKTLQRYEFMRAPGVVLQHLRGKVQSFIANKIEEEISQSLSHLSLNELDRLMFAVMHVAGEIAEENIRKQKEMEEVMAAAKLAKKQDKMQNRAEKRANAKKGK